MSAAFSRPGDKFFNAHEGHVYGRAGGAHANVAFVFHNHQGAGGGNADVGARDAHFRGQKSLAQLAPGNVGQLLGALRGLAQLFGEQLGDVLLAFVDGRGRDVRGRFSGQLHDVFAQVGFQADDARGLERVVDADLLAEHGLALNHGFDPVPLGQVQDDVAGLAPVCGPVHVHAVLEQLLFEALEHLGQVLHDLGLGRGHPGFDRVLRAGTPRTRPAFCFQTRRRPWSRP